MTERPSADEVATLFKRFQETGRRRDRNALVDAHLGFAYHIAKRYQRRGVPDDDIRQIALLALVKAVDRFDPDVGVAFTSFAGRTIEGEIKRHFRDAAWSVRVPRSTKELHLRVRSATEELTHQLGHSPSVAEVAEYMEVSRDEVVEAMGAGAAFTPSSLDAPRGDDDTTDRSGRLAETDTELEQTDERILVERLIAQLDERDQEIVRLRFFEELTQSEIADRVGMSQMHVSRLLRKAFETMRTLADA